MKRPLRSKKWKHDYARLSESDDLVFLCLPFWFVNVLLDSTERMLWTNVWEDNQGSFPTLTQEDRDRISYAIWQLSLEECDMQITVNPTITNTIEPCGCGCGGTGGTGGSCPYPPGVPLPNPGIPWPLPQDPDTEVPPVPDIPPPGSVLDPVRCRLANWTWSMLRLHIVTLRGYTLGLQSATTIALGIISLLPAALVARIGAGIIAQIAGIIVQIRGYLEVAELLFDPILEFWDDNQQDLVCHFYNGTSQDALSEYVQNALFDHLTAFWDGLGTNSILRNLLWGFWRNAFFRDSLFGLALNAIVPDNWHPSHPTIDCDSCSSEPGGGDWIPAPEGYYWVPLLMAHASVWEYTMNAPGGGNIANYEVLDGGYLQRIFTDALNMSTVAAIVVDNVLQDPILPTDGTDIVGIAIDYLSTPPEPHAGPDYGLQRDRVDNDINIDSQSWAVPNRFWVRNNGFADPEEINAILVELADRTDDCDLSTNFEFNGLVGWYGSAGTWSQLSRVRFLVAL